MTSRGRGRVAALSAALAVVSTTACTPGGTAADDPATVRWYVADATDHAALARGCADTAGVRIELVEAPLEPAERRRDLVQRLRTGDDLDVIGLDTALVAELADADLLASLPDPAVAELTEGRTEASVDAVTIDDRVVAAPWTYEPQVLFHRGQVAERAGLDMSAAVTWADLTAGASRVGATVQVAGTTTDWVRALLAGAGTPYLSEDRSDPVVGLDGPGSAAAAEVVQGYAEAEVGPGPALDAAASFAAPGGAFLVGPVSLLGSPELAPVRGEIRIAPYPVVAEGESSVAPLAGTALAVAATSDDPDAAVTAITCLTAADAQDALVTSGRLPTLADALTSEAVATAVGRLDVVGEALSNGAPEPRSPWASLVSGAVETSWAPVTEVDSGAPGRSAREARRLIDGGLP